MKLFFQSFMIFVIINVSNQILVLCLFVFFFFFFREIISCCVSISLMNCPLDQPYVETRKTGFVFYRQRGHLYSLVMCSDLAFLVELFSDNRCSTFIFLLYNVYIIFISP